MAKWTLVPSQREINNLKLWIAGACAPLVLMGISGLRDQPERYPLRESQTIERKVSNDELPKSNIRFDNIKPQKTLEQQVKTPPLREQTLQVAQVQYLPQQLRPNTTQPNQVPKAVYLPQTKSEAVPVMQKKPEIIYLNQAKNKPVYPAPVPKLENKSTNTYQQTSTKKPILAPKEKTIKKIVLDDETPRRRQIADLIYRTSSESKAYRNTLVGIIESNLDQNKTSETGAKGVMQLTAIAVEELNRYIKQGKTNGPRYSLTRVRTELNENIRAGVNYLEDVLDPHYQEMGLFGKEKDELVLLAYNGGISTVDRAINLARICKEENPYSFETVIKYLRTDTPEKKEEMKGYVRKFRERKSDNYEVEIKVKDNNSKK